jgi:TolB-like protein/DNA-binding winged helix-turn-helix (wHTH) protein
LYEFGPFRMDTVRGTLTRDEVPVPLTGKCFEVLMHLVRYSPATVSKDELMKTVWPDTFVEESNLTQHVSLLRKALGESPQDRLYIVTVPGQGYRFVAQVRKTTFPLDESADDKASSGAGHERTLDDALPEDSEMLQPIVSSRHERSFPRRLIWAGAILLILAISAIGYLRRQSRSADTNPTVSASIVVLPFADLSQAKDQEYFSDGLTDELTNDLARIRGLKVIARSSAFQFKAKNEDLPTIGRRLGVANVLEGSVRKEGDRVRITAELTKVDDGFQLWAETYDRKIDDVLAVQEEIARAVTVALQVRILDPEKGSDPAHFRRNPDAYEAYLQAQYFFARGEDKEDLNKALGYADTAIRLDPGFAPSSALRSSVLYTAATIGLRNHEETYRAAKEDAEKAIALDPDSSAGYVALASVKIGYEWDWNAADAALKKATELRPGSAEVLSYRAYLYECLGRLDEAIALTEQASVLDPMRTNAYLGALLFTAGRYEEAQAALKMALAMNPKLEGGHAKLASILLAQGHFPQALAELEAEPGEWERLTGQSIVYWALNRSTESDASLAKLIATHSEDSPYQVAEVYAYRNAVDKAFEWMDRAYRQRDPGLNQIKLDPLLKKIRSDHRFEMLLNKMRLSS